MHKKDKLSKNEKKTSRKLLVTIGCIAMVIFVIIGVLLGKSLYDDYHDRPLASGLQYVGRNYNSPCYFGTCYGPSSEAYYYATNLEPQNIVNLFPGWKIDQVATTTEEVIWKGNYASDVTYYHLVNTQTGASSAYEYIIDKKQAMQAGHLLANDKKYIVRIWSDDSSGYNSYAALKR